MQCTTKFLKKPRVVFIDTDLHSIVLFELVAFPDMFIEGMFVSLLQGSFYLGHDFWPMEVEPIILSSVFFLYFLRETKLL